MSTDPFKSCTLDDKRCSWLKAVIKSVVAETKIISYTCAPWSLRYPQCILAAQSTDGDTVSLVVLAAANVAWGVRYRTHFFLHTNTFILILVLLVVFKLTLTRVTSLEAIYQHDCHHNPRIHTLIMTKQSKRIKPLVEDILYPQGQRS